ALRFSTVLPYRGGGGRAAQAAPSAIPHPRCRALFYFGEPAYRGRAPLRHLSVSDLPLLITERKVTGGGLIFLLPLRRRYCQSQSHGVLESLLSARGILITRRDARHPQTSLLRQRRSRFKVSN
ncbi:unnamed protein product, partial [Amoebophrya sp. A120]